MEIRWLSIGCGDGIHIRYYGNDAVYHNLFIDGGVESGDVYTKALRKEIELVVTAKEEIDLWIITHIDDDHIGGVLRFIKDEALRTQLDLSKTEFWFNYNSYDYDTGLKTTSLKSVRQGCRLRNFLTEASRLNQSVSVACGTIDLQGCKLTILTPDKDQLDKLYERWLKEETKIRQKKQTSKKVAKPNDYHLRLDEFDLTNFTEDLTEFNASSISMLLEFRDSKVLLLADSQPSKVYDALSAMGYSEDNKLKLRMMQLAHHGSKYNTNDDLLKIIECTNFVISADGVNKHNLPNKELLARVKKNFPDQESLIHLTHKNTVTTALLKSDEKPTVIRLVFPKQDENYIKLNL
jgi:beta-lactamase superfamily II metal-dependent hydrolase